jgi:hypothetical protein
MSSPFCTIQRGFDIGAAQNKTVIVLSGNYTTPNGAVLNVTNPVNDYVVTGVGIGNPVLSVALHQGSVIVVTNSTTKRVDIRLDGFVIRGGSGDGQGGGPGSGLDVTGGSNRSATKVAIINSTITRNEFQGVSALNSTVLIENTTVSQNGFQGVLTNNSILSIRNSSIRESGYINGTSFSGIGGFVFVGSDVTADRITVGPKNGGNGISAMQSTFVITNALVHRNGQSSVTDAAVEIAAAPQLKQVLLNVTVADNIGSFPGIRCSNATPTVANAVAFNNPVPNQAMITGCTVTNSAFYGASSPNQDTNNCTDKLFVNSATANYVPLKGGAPPCSLVGQGLDSITVGGLQYTAPQDIVGVPRPSGRFDIGAYQSN